MSILLPILVALIFLFGVYLLLQKRVFSFALGLALLSHGANLVVFGASGVVRGKSPIIGDGEEVLAVTAANPVPQALVLTAIVIGFGVLAFTLVLLYKLTQARQSTDLDELKGEL